VKSLFLLTICGVICAGQTAPSKPAVKSAVAKPVTPKVTAFNKATFEAYIRHLYVWPPPIEIAVSDPKPSSLPGFMEVKVTASQGKASHSENFFVSKDGQKILRGQAFDVAQNPFKPQNDLLKTEFRPNLGAVGAPVVIVEFTDFECPYCKDEAKKLRDNLIKDFPKEVRFYFMDFPLEQVHPWAKTAAMAGQCIFKQEPDVFWEYHDWIFEHQTEMTPDTLVPKILEFVHGKKIDSIQLSRCIETKASEAEVDKTLAQGRALEVGSTPTLFVNGRKLEGAIDWPDLKRIIEYEIQYQKTAKNAGEDCGCDVKLALPPGMK
jgi:protein-disulfide isomerase